MRLLLLVSLALLSGCASLSTLEEARALPRGHGRLTLSTAANLGINSASPPLPNGAPAPIPSLDIGARVGLGSGTEIGLRLSPMSGARADFKVQFVARGLDLALDPTVTVHAVLFAERPRFRIEAHVPLLVGVAVGRRKWGYIGGSVRGVVTRYAPISVRTRFGKPTERAWTAFDVGAGLLLSQGVDVHGKIRMMTGVDVRYDLVGGTGLKLAVQGGLLFDLAPVDREARRARRDARRDSRRDRRDRRRDGREQRRESR